jgi:hypothetical protein
MNLDTQAQAITIANLYKALQLHDTIILTCERSIVPALRKRLSKKKYSEGKKLKGFIDDSLTLSFKIIADIPNTTQVKLRISLTSTEPDNLEGIAKVELSSSIEDIAEGRKPEQLFLEPDIEDIYDEEDIGFDSADDIWDDL